MLVLKVRIHILQWWKNGICCLKCNIMAWSFVKLTEKGREVKLWKGFSQACCYVWEIWSMIALVCPNAQVKQFQQLRTRVVNSTCAIVILQRCHIASQEVAATGAHAHHIFGPWLYCSKSWPPWLLFWTGAETHICPWFLSFRTIFWLCRDFSCVICYKNILACL